MTDERVPSLAEIAAADLLLDAVGRGATDLPAGSAEDQLFAGELAAWRTDLDDDLPAFGPLTIDPVEPPPARAHPLSGHPVLRRVLVGVAAAALVAGGLSFAARDAGPDSPLWPVTRVVYRETADTRLTEHTIDRARSAANAGRYEEARRLLDDASDNVARIRDPDVARRLRADIDAVRARLTASMAPPAPAPAPQPSTAPTPEGSPGTAPGGTDPGGTDPGGSDPGGSDPGGSDDGGGGAQPSPNPPGGIVPGLPLPSLPIPLPSVGVPGLPPIVPGPPPIGG
jgi:uncharacterized membrane protein YgcG